MANTLLLKRSSVAGKAPTTANLQYGELSLNYTDGTLYFKTNVNTIGSFVSNGSSHTANVLTITGGIFWANGAIYSSGGATYPGAGIPNSTGSAWTTSYTTSGSGTVIPLATGATLTTPTITGYTETLVAIGTLAASYSFPATLNTGTFFTATIATAGTACTFTMPTASAGKSFMLRLTQSGTTAGTAAFTSVKWPYSTAPYMSSPLNAVDLYTFISDGTSWFGTYIQALG